MAGDDSGTEPSSRRISKQSFRLAYRRQLHLEGEDAVIGGGPDGDQVVFV